MRALQRERAGAYTGVDQRMSRTHASLGNLATWALVAVCMAAAAACTSAEMRPISFATTNDDATGDTGDGDGDGGTGDGDGDTGDGDGDTGDGDGEVGDPPMVVETAPAPGSTGVDSNSSIVVSFSEAMLPGSITSNGAADTCSGGVQLSDDDFATCVPLANEVGAAAGDTIFTLTPLEPLDSRRNYHIRVAAFATSAAGVELGATYDTSEPFVTRYYHTITIDGRNDFDNSDERFATSSLGFDAYVAWDRDWVYLGMSGSDLDGGSEQLFLTGYVGGMPGSMGGVSYQGQTPSLPFAARWHLRWRADDNYTNMQEFGGAWGDAVGIWFNIDDWAHLGTFVEMRMPRGMLEVEGGLALVMSLVRETNNNQGTYAGVPGGGIVDGVDPDFSSWFEFDLEGSVLPSEHLGL
jgi:hypothetical protein